jgi:hypothetical protein|tara:strand:- start:699 stop:1031 length:333 start_codon:yes stop_codon:yes gene_type:complete
MDNLDNKSFFLGMLLLLIFLFIVISATTTNAYEKDDSSTKVMTTCRLASQIMGDNQRVCVFLGANNTQYREYLPYDAGVCPREFQCPYRPNETPFSLKSVIKSIKKQFRD